MHRTLEELQAALSHVEAAPADGGPVRALCVRPERNERRPLTEAHVTMDGGMDGDRWGRGGDPEAQLTLMSARVAETLADPDRWCLAGDQVYLDLDLSETNLPVGQRLAIGSATLEITAKAHLGCGKFAERFGVDALKFVNSKELRSLRLRGVHARVVEPGAFRVGDLAQKI